MRTINTDAKFVKGLAELNLVKQREIAVKFIQNVLDLNSDSRIPNILKIAANNDSTAKELMEAYRTSRSLYLETHPHSDLTELNFKHQAAHFVAEACIVCLGPIFQNASPLHLAQKVAMYCRMARTCSSMPHSDVEPSFKSAEDATKQIIADQFEILSEFIN